MTNGDQYYPPRRPPRSPRPRYRLRLAFPPPLRLRCLLVLPPDFEDYAFDHQLHHSPQLYLLQYGGGSAGSFLLYLSLFAAYYDASVDPSSSRPRRALSEKPFFCFSIGTLIFFVVGLELC